MKNFANFLIKMVLIIIMHIMWIILFATGDFWYRIRTDILGHFLVPCTLLLCIMIGIQILIYRKCPLSSKCLKVVFIIINICFTIYTYGFTIRLWWEHILIDVITWLF